MLATAAAKSGVAPLSMPVSADDTCCSAKGNMLSGNASHKTPSHAVPAQSARRTGARPAGISDSVTNPMAIRPTAISASLAGGGCCRMAQDRTP